MVLEWTSPACPFTAAKYRSGEIQSLQSAARRNGVVWIAVNTAAEGAPGHLTAAAARAYLARVGANVDAFLFDETGRVGRAYGARATPSAFIIDRAGRLAYEGAISAPPGAEGGGDYVRRALDALESGGSVRTAATQPFGCPVEY